MKLVTGTVFSVLPRLGVVAFTVIITALDRVSGVRWFVATRASRGSVGSGLSSRGCACVRLLMRLWVGLVVRFVCVNRVSTDTYSHSHEHFTHSFNLSQARPHHLLRTPCVLWPRQSS